MDDKMMIRIIASILIPIMPWLKIKAKETDTPIDDLGLQIVEMVLREAAK